MRELKPKGIKIKTLNAIVDVTQGLSLGIGN
jgi:hypothetical protein